MHRLGHHFVLGCLLLVTSGAAAEPPRPARIYLWRDVMILSGRIETDLKARVEAALDRHPQVRMVEVESYGGLSTSAYSIGSLLNQRGVGVRVRSRCASACVLLWAQADVRQLFPGARLGLHAVRAGKTPPFWLAPLVRANNRRAQFEPLQKAGFPPALIERGYATPAGSMLWLTPGELAANGVAFDASAPGRCDALERPCGTRLVVWGARR